MLPSKYSVHAHQLCPLTQACEIGLCHSLYPSTVSVGTARSIGPRWPFKGVARLHRLGRAA